MVRPKKLLFTWEWGAGNGHLRRFLPIAQSLIAQGHEVTLVVKDLRLASEMFGALNVCVMESPQLPPALSDSLRNPQSFAGLAWNLGAGSQDALSRSIAQWLQLIKTIQPTHILSDFGIVSGYLASVLGIPLARIGLGYGTPCKGQVLAGMFGQSVTTEERYLSQRVLYAFQFAASVHGLRSPNDWDGLFPVNGPVFLTTISAFDPYSASRSPEQYLGVWSEDYGDSPRWPSGSRPRAFAYLAPDVRLRNWCRVFSQAGLNTLYALNGQLPPGVLPLPSAMNVANRLVNTKELAGRCDLVITNGNHGMTIRAMELGIPLLMLPSCLEHHWNSQVVEQLGMGVNLLKLSEQEWLPAIQAVVSQMASSEQFLASSKAVMRANQNACQNTITEVLRWIEMN